MSALYKPRYAWCKNDFSRFRAYVSDNPSSCIPYLSVSVCYHVAQSFLSPSLFFFLSQDFYNYPNFFLFMCLSALYRSLFFQIILKNFPLPSHCPGVAGTVLYYQHKREMLSILLLKEMEFWAARIQREALFHPHTPDCKVHSLGGIIKQNWSNFCWLSELTQI